MGSGTVEFYSATQGIVYGLKDFLTNCWMVRIKLSGCLMMSNKQCLHLKVGLRFYQGQCSGYSKLGSSCLVSWAYLYMFFYLLVVASLEVSYPWQSGKNKHSGASYLCVVNKVQGNFNSFVLSMIVHYGSLAGIYFL